MDNQTDAQIHDEGKWGPRFVDEAGISHKYSLFTGTIYVIVNSLSVSERFGRTWPIDDPSGQVVSRRIIQGFASLCDSGISVIGVKNWTMRVPLAIHGGTADEYAKAVQAWNRRNHENDALPYSDANLGFTNGDTELGTKGEWWLALHVAEKTLDSLVDAILNKREHSLQIGVELPNVYTDAGPGELDYGEPVNLFLRPSIRKDDVRTPEISYGQLTTWDLRFSGTAVLSDPFAQGLTLASDTMLAEEPRSPSEAEKALPALERLTTGVGALRSTVIWVGWLLAGALIMSVLIR